MAEPASIQESQNLSMFLANHNKITQVGLSCGSITFLGCTCGSVPTAVQSLWDSVLFSSRCSSSWKWFTAMKSCWRTSWTFVPITTRTSFTWRPARSTCCSKWVRLPPKSTQPQHRRWLWTPLTHRLFSRWWGLDCTSWMETAATSTSWMPRRELTSQRLISFLRCSTLHERVDLNSFIDLKSFYFIFWLLLWHETKGSIKGKRL